MNLRCICEDRDLADVLREARRHGWTSAARVAQATGCGDNCRTCFPYIARMLETGRAPTANDLMSAEELRRYAPPGSGAALDDLRR